MPNYTKRELAATLKNMLQEKPLEKITVSELTAECGVSRMTFYYHFRDIYDLVEWMCIENLRSTASEQKTGDTWREWLIRIFESMYRQKTFVGNLNRSLDRAQIEVFWTEQIQDLLLGMVRDECARSGADGISEEAIGFIASFYRYSFVGILMEWFDQGMKGDYDQIIDALSRIMEGSIENAVQRFRGESSENLITEE